MLDSSFAMLRPGLFIFVFVLLTLLLPGPVQGIEPRVTSPQSGQVLQGMVPIIGSSALDGFLYTEVTFAYTEDPTDTWFLVAISSDSVSDGLLATWDTTVISDGSYTIRLRVSLEDGSSRETFVPRLRIRNYSPIETATPMPPVPETEYFSTITATLTPLAPPTPLPPNPAAITLGKIYSTLGQGALIALVFTILFAALLHFRRK